MGGGTGRQRAARRLVEQQSRQRALRLPQRQQPRQRQRQQRFSSSHSRSSPAGNAPRRPEPVEGRRPEPIRGARRRGVQGERQAGSGFAVSEPNSTRAAPCGRRPPADAWGSARQTNRDRSLIAVRLLLGRAASLPAAPWPAVAVAGRGVVATVSPWGAWGGGVGSGRSIRAGGRATGWRRGGRMLRPYVRARGVPATAGGRDVARSGAGPATPGPGRFARGRRAVVGRAGTPVAAVETARRAVSTPSPGGQRPAAGNAPRGGRGAMGRAGDRGWAGRRGPRWGRAGDPGAGTVRPWPPGGGGAGQGPDDGECVAAVRPWPPGGGGAGAASRRGGPVPPWPPGGRGAGRVAARSHPLPRGGCGAAGWGRRRGVVGSVYPWGAWGGGVGAASPGPP